MRKRSRFPGVLFLLLIAGVGLGLAGLLAPAFCTDEPAANKITITTKGMDPPARFADRYAAEDARTLVRSTDGNLDLMITRHAVALQLSDKGLARVRKQLHSKDDAEAGNGAGWFQDAVMAMVGSFLEHSAQCPLEHVRDARYVDGRIVIVADTGQRPFDRIEIDDKDAMTSFSDKDARKFVRELRRVRGL